MDTAKTKKRLSPGRKILLAVGIVLLLAVLLGFLAGNALFNLALSPVSDKSSVLEADINRIEREEEQSPEQKRLQEEYQEANSWLAQDGVTAETTSYDGLSLSAYIVENDSSAGKWAVLFHGYLSNAAHMAWFGKNFYDEGYSVLMPDARAHGKSEGDYIGMGWHERLDALGWIDLILERDPAAEIVLHGISMGGATVMMISGEALPENVVAIIEDCGYSSVWDEFSYQLKELFGLPEFPLMHFSNLVTQIRAGYSLREASAIEQVAKSKTPILFIHGDSDTFVPTYMVYEVYDAAACEKELIIAEGGGHGEAASALGEEYWDSVFDFIARAAA